MRKKVDPAASEAAFTDPDHAATVAFIRSPFDALITMALTIDGARVAELASREHVRMTVPDVIDLYPRVPVGTPVLIG